MNVLLGKLVGVGVPLAVRVGSLVEVLVLYGVGVWVACTGGVRVATLGTYRRKPVWIRVEDRQLAAINSLTLTPNAWLMR